MPQSKVEAPDVRLEDFSFLSRFEEGARPSVLYHYTTRQGLLGIVREKGIRASDARYLNDAQELTTAVTIARTLIQTRRGTAPPKFGQLYSRLDGVLESLALRHDAFVFSMSADSGDVLSQWRAYSRSGNAYAIGFDSEALMKAAPRGSHLSSCQYEEPRQRELVGLLLDDTEGALNADVIAGKTEEEALLRALAVFAIGFVLVAPLLKHRSFREEKEWRLTLPVISAWDQGVEFRDAGTLLVPYCNIHLPAEKLPINEVVVGPTPHPDLEARAVSALLTVAGLPGARVRKSEIPYRNW